MKLHLKKLNFDKREGFQKTCKLLKLLNSTLCKCWCHSYNYTALVVFLPWLWGNQPGCPWTWWNLHVAGVRLLTWVIWDSSWVMLVWTAGFSQRPPQYTPRWKLGYCQTYYVSRFSCISGLTTSSSTCTYFFRCLCFGMCCHFIKWKTIWILNKTKHSMSLTQKFQK